MPLSKTTRDHEEIRRWAEARSGKPAEVKNTESNGEPGIIRIMFPGARNAKDSNLQEISWEEFFTKFDDNGLELIYQEKTSGGQQSNFNKLIYPGNEHESGHGRSSRGASGGRTKSASATGRRSSAGTKTKSATKSATKKAATKSRAKSASKSTGRKSAAKSSSGRSQRRSSAA